MNNSHSKRFYEFGPFRLDVTERLLLCDGAMVALTPKAFDTLVILIENSGRLVEREELMKRLWPDTFVEEANLAHHVSVLRKTFEEGAKGNKYIQTVPRRGYRFIADVKRVPDQSEVLTLKPERESTDVSVDEKQPRPAIDTQTAGTRTNAFYRHRKHAWLGVLAAIAILSAIAGYLLLSHRVKSRRPLPRELSRLTFEAGLQSNPTWSPDGRFIAYSSDASGNFDIWVQQVGGDKPVQVTTSPAHDWQPDWSPDGKTIVFRSERGGGGLFLVPALGGREIKISTFGHQPRWSPDGSQILFLRSNPEQNSNLQNLYVVGLDGNSPREVLADFVSGFLLRGNIRGVGWYPDGRRISILGVNNEFGPGLWTISVDGGTPVKSEWSGEVGEQIKSTPISFGRFCWSPTGRELYLEGISRDVRNIWKVNVDPQTLRWITGPERLTTGSGLDTDIALSQDGKEIAFTVRTQNTRIWSLPFDAAIGKVKGEGHPITAPGINAHQPALSSDGKKLAFVVDRADMKELSAARRAGRNELRVKSMEDGSETLVASDDFFRAYPVWSRDGNYLTYMRYRPLKADGAQFERAIWILPIDGGDERQLTSATAATQAATDWSADGQWLLATLPQTASRGHQICLLPVSAAPRAEVEARVLISKPDYTLWHERFSPDERWILFQGVSLAEPGVSTIYVVPAAGGEWINITDGKHWDDKPRWSPDGKTIYFASNRSTGFINVWGIRFDPVSGGPVGEPFSVTAFESPGKMIFPNLTFLQISLSEDRLVVPVMEVSGSIWILENVDSGS